MPSTRPPIAAGQRGVILQPSVPERALRVLHRDDAMLIIDKPAGLPVHLGPGGGETLDQHFRQLRFGYPSDPGLAHRLDKDTSGCLVLGRTKAALAALGRLFKEGKVRKTYWAVAMGQLNGDAGTVDAPLARRSHEKRSWWMKVDPAGDPSMSHWKVLGRGDGLVWLELSPQTGRTHQLRVHCAHLGVPIAGDHVYGGERSRAGARHMHLHARAVTVPLDPHAPAAATADPPDHMWPLLTACGWQGPTE